MKELSVAKTKQMNKKPLLICCVDQKVTCEDIMKCKRHHIKAKETIFPTTY